MVRTEMMATRTTVNRVSRPVRLCLRWKVRETIPVLWPYEKQYISFLAVFGEPEEGFTQPTNRWSIRMFNIVCSISISISITCSSCRW